MNKKMMDGRTSNQTLRNACSYSGLTQVQFSRELIFELDRQNYDVSAYTILAWLKPETSESSRRCPRLVARVAQARWRKK